MKTSALSFLLLAPLSIACSSDDKTTGASGSAGAAANASGAGGTSNTSASGAGGASGTASSDDVDAEVEAGCAKFAAAGKELNCSATSCALKEDPSLVASIKTNGCQSQLHVAGTCILGQPTTSFQCDDQGTAELKDGFCTTELDALTSCAMK